MIHLLALGSAAFYGAADFLGGLASRRGSTIAVVTISQAAGLLLLLVLLAVLPSSAPARGDFAWGSAAGLAGGVGVALLYRALAIGTMGVVAPTTAVCAVVIPVAAEAVRGARVSATVGAGICLALIAIALVSQQRPPAAAAPADSPGPDVLGSGAPRRGIGLALLSGVAIGLFFLALARTGAGAGLWPLVSARLTSVAFFSTLALAGSGGLRLSGPAGRTAIAAGLLDMLANALYLLSTRAGPLSVAVTLSSLYPASTIVLARIVLRERFTGWQWLGIACALAAIVLIVAGGRP